METLQTQLTVRDRILLHLSEFSLHEHDHQAPPQVSQKGIANAVGIHQRHIPQYVRPMIAEGLLAERSSYIEGGRQHQKVYFLTSQGRTAAAWFHNTAPDNNRTYFNNAQKIALGTNSTFESITSKLTRPEPSRSRYFSISRYRDR